MNVAEHLNPKFICIELQSVSKDEAIKELAAVFKNSQEINDFDQFLKDVFEREKMMSTGIGNGVAVPHARTDAVNKLIIAMGKSSRGIDFDAIDKQPVNLIFLMGAPTKDMSDYLRVLAYLTRMLSKKDFCKKLVKAKSLERIIKIFSNSKESYIQKWSAKLKGLIKDEDNS